LKALNDASYCSVTISFQTQVKESELIMKNLLYKYGEVWRSQNRFQNVFSGQL
jgi:hypothetical protein